MAYTDEYLEWQSMKQTENLCPLLEAAGTSLMSLWIRSPTLVARVSECLWNGALAAFIRVQHSQ
jgi:hypothetical protein